MKNHKVSVIIANYNHGQYIGEAIESILAQRYLNFELIIIDDGSSDSSREIIHSFKDIRIRTIMQENLGQAAAFNAGFQIAKGRYIAFIDSDDKWKPDKLSKVIHYFQEKTFCSIVQHNLEIIDENSVSNGRLHPGIKSGIRDVLQAYFEENHTGFFSATSGITCKKSDLAKVFPLDQSWRICADVAFTRPLALMGKVCTLPEPLGYYRIHDSNFWMNSIEQKDLLYNQQKYCEYTNQWLSKYGTRKKIDFKKSAIYRKWVVEQLPRSHPKRLWMKIFRVFSKS